MANEGQIRIGNVSFYRNDVKIACVRQNENGEKINCVWLNNNTKINFKDQDNNANASVVTGTYAGPSSGNGKYGTGFKNITGLYIEGSKQDDFYHLSNCDDYKVNVKDGGRDIVRTFESEGKTNGTINADNNDVFEQAGQFVCGNEGFFIHKD